jgi:NADH-quinone oxidoreductase subunit N
VAELGIGSVGSLLPELVLLIGGLLILLLDIGQSGQNGQSSGRAYMMVSVLFLIISLIGVMFQAGMAPVIEMGMVALDPFASFLKMIIIVGMILVAVGGGSFMNRHTNSHGEFWSLFLFVTLAMTIAVSANNLLLLFLSIEALSITSYILAGFLREDRRSSEAGLKYFIYGSVSSALMLYGMSLLYGASGSLDLTEIGAAFSNDATLHTVIPLATLLTLAGLGFKASLAPFYQWAPDTYDGAPTPVTAYLSTASKAVGFAVMARVLIVAMGAYQMNWVPILGGLAVLTMTVGNFVALRQRSVKRMLAYSSVAQAGYILLGLTSVVSGESADVTTLGMNGLNGLLIYLFAYLFTNIGAFMVVLAVEDYTGSTDVTAYSDLVHRSPALAWSMLVFMLSLTGIPLTGGFVGKFYVFGATVQHQYFWLAGIALINVGVGAFYYMRVVRQMFFVGGEDEAEPVKVPVPIPLQVVVTLCVLATLWIGIYPPNLIEWANNASQQLIAMM